MVCSCCKQAVALESVLFDCFMLGVVEGSHSEPAVHGDDSHDLLELSSEHSEAVSGM